MGRGLLTAALTYAEAGVLVLLFVTGWVGEV